MARLWCPDVPIETHQMLKHGEITACELIPWGSNYTFCVTLRFEGREDHAVYKPRRGERPLWDFPDGTLYRREYAAFVTSQALGWPFIPPTVIRRGPHGAGSVQLFVDSEPLRSIRELQETADLELARIAAFDFIANNADRKGGHVLRAPNGTLWGIDHGLCFHVVSKVRTVLLHFFGQPVPAPVLTEVQSFRTDSVRVKGLCEILGRSIGRDEVDALLRRIDWMLAHGSYPSLNPHRSVPWPPF